MTSSVSLPDESGGAGVPVTVTGVNLTGADMLVGELAFYESGGWASIAGISLERIKKKVPVGIVISKNASTCTVQISPGEVDFVGATNIAADGAVLYRNANGYSATPSSAAYIRVGFVRANGASGAATSKGRIQK